MGGDRDHAGCDVAGHHPLRSRIGATFHLAEAAEAHRALGAGRVRGRILILP
ncbi:zinc-binding dehydrogenase [Brevibacterium sp.]|uniref:zinc-binding dehydrogenase n=1 Tax=Brevibacterium sp. TaxID=1701 RepID=UPI00344C5726